MRFTLVLACLLVPAVAEASTFVNQVAQTPAVPTATDTVSVWVNSDTALGETVGVETHIGTTFTKILGTFDTSTNGANWRVDIPAEPVGTTVSYQLFVRNQSDSDYLFSGFNWSYTVVAVPDAGVLDAAVPDASVLDAAVPDAAIADAAPADAPSADAGAIDAGAIDASTSPVADASPGIPDAPPPDDFPGSFGPDAAGVAGGNNTGGCGCRVAPGGGGLPPGPVLAGLALLLVYTRRRRCARRRR